MGFMPEDPLPFHDLMLDTTVWTSWTPREEIAPAFEVAPHGGLGGRPVLVIQGNDNALSCGCWQLALPHLKSGQHYRIEASFSTAGVIAPGKSVRAILIHGDQQFYGQLDPVSKKEGWHRLCFDWVQEDAIQGLTLRLFLAWSAKGLVRWGEVRLFDLTGHLETPTNRVRLAAISGNPEKPESPAQCLDFYAERIDAIDGHVDLICLPELINTTRLPGDPTNWAEPIPGPTSERLSAIAQERGTYIGASILERQGEAIYNTGFLIDRSGGLVGKYRKTQLTLNEGLLRGCAPGNELPIFHTDFGVVAYMICYDGHYPEVARVLALKGAKVILFSNMGDAREGGSVWEPMVRTRAVDNQVHIVAAVNSGRSCVVSPKGDLLAMTDRTAGSIAVADCDMDASVCDFTKRPIYGRYDQLRRADLFGDLGKHFWDSV
ncbi:MAG: putative amidohydrolase [Candidatus Latescibacterota bacterium]|jgi:predicted amidohydrolase